MVYSMFAKVSASAALALAMFAWTSDANAFGHHHRWHGSSGGWGGGSSGGGWGGSSGGSSGGGWGSSGGGGWGSSGGGWGGGSSGGGSGGGWGHHHKHHGGWRWGGSNGGSSGGYTGGSSGGWGGSSGGYGSSGGGSSGGGGSYYYAPGVEMAPVDPSYGPPTVAPPAGGIPSAPAPIVPAPGTSTSNTTADGLLAVQVPDDARIFVNGQSTTSTGQARQYVSRNLAPGFNYTYEVRAELVRDGRTIEQVKKIDVRAGETANLAFDFPASDSTETSLTVHVPSDAKVYLAGNATKANGETRIFRTTGLSGTKAWDGYTVRVELERGGRTITKEETITLKAGESQEIRFNFDGDQIASAR